MFFNIKEEFQPSLDQIAVVIPENSKVVASTNFIYSSLGKHQVQTYVNYDDSLRDGKIQATPEDFFGMANKFDIDYVILLPREAEKFNIGNDEYMGYRLEALPFETNVKLYRR
ncbi:hypothetical protein D3C87_410720 [compost metagenome]